MDETREMIAVLSFGGQYNQLIARRVREAGVYSEVVSYETPLEELLAMEPKGIIFSGGPNSVYDEKSPHYDKAVFEAGIPILGICYGSQLMAWALGGEVATAPVSEYGHTQVELDAEGSLLLQGTAAVSTCWMSHTDYISAVPEGFRITGRTRDCPCAAMENEERKLYATQFHPEVTHTQEGMKILRNFIFHICGCTGDWKMDTFIEDTVRQLKEKIGDDRVLLGLSGGVDSSVTAALLSRAIGDQLICVFVDHGLMRKNEGDEVEQMFGKDSPIPVRFIRVDARDRYYIKLAGYSDPETKRHIIGDEFVNVFGDEARKLQGEGKKIRYLAQGTIYPDVIESGGKTGSDVIKSHHNVGGLPIEVVKELGFDETPVEPLRDLFKDEVREVGLALGLPRDFVYRQPFPGPGLGVRIVGDVTYDKVRIVQEADWIFREELAKAGIDQDLGQYFAALTNMRSVGVMGDHRTYGLAVVLRAVLTSDFMTAEAAEIPWPVLQTCMNRIINEVKGVNRVLYDITSKPPGTIELE